MSVKGFFLGLGSMGVVACAFGTGWWASDARSAPRTRLVEPSPLFTPVSHIAGMPVSVEAMESLAASLDRDVMELDLHQSPLSEAISLFAEKIQRPILFDTEELSRLKIKTDVPVTIKLTNHPAASALRLALRPLGLTYDLRDDVIVVTALDAVESSAVTKVYPIDDMIGGWTNWTIDEVVVTRAIKTSLPKAPPPTASDERASGYEQLNLPAQPRLSIFGDAVILRGSMRHHEHVAQLLKELRALKANGMSTQGAVAMVAQATKRETTSPARSFASISPPSVAPEPVLAPLPEQLPVRAPVRKPIADPLASARKTMAERKQVFTSTSAPKPSRIEAPAIPPSVIPPPAGLPAANTPPASLSSLESPAARSGEWTTSMPWLVQPGGEARCRLELKPAAQPRPIDLRLERPKTTPPREPVAASPPSKTAQWLAKVAQGSKRTAGPESPLERLVAATELNSQSTR